MIRLAALGRPADPRPDGALLAAFLDDRDEPAFAELVRRHAGLVWGVCRRGLPDPADAEDAFQATFLVLVRRAHRLTTSATVGPWLYRVAAWTARALRRKNARRLARRRDLPTTLPTPSVPEPPFDLDAALLGLPDRYRQAVVLCCLAGLTHREAADRLGCAEGTVSSLVSRGLGKLRARLAADPAPVLAVAAGAAAPAGLSAAAVKSAAALQLASLSAAASPAVAHLTEGVLRMFWVKKAAAAGLAAVMLVTTGVGVGVSVHQAPQAVAADDKPTAKAARPAPPADVAKMEAELKDVRGKLNEIALRSWRLTEPEIEEYGRLSGRAAELEARIKVAQAKAREKAPPAEPRVEDLLRQIRELRNELAVTKAQAAAEREQAEAAALQARAEAERARDNERAARVAAEKAEADKAAPKNPPADPRAEDLQKELRRLRDELAEARAQAEQERQRAETVANFLAAQTAGATDEARKPAPKAPSAGDVDAQLTDLIKKRRELGDRQAILNLEKQQLDQRIAEFERRKAAAPPAGRRVVVSLTSKAGSVSVQVNEFSGNTLTSVTSFPGVQKDKQDWSPVRDFLARVRADRNGPRAVTVTTIDNPRDALIQAVKQACLDAGFAPSEVTVQEAVVPSQLGERR